MRQTKLPVGIWEEKKDFLRKLFSRIGEVRERQQDELYRRRPWRNTLHKEVYSDERSGGTMENLP